MKTLVHVRYNPVKHEALSSTLELVLICRKGYRSANFSMIVHFNCLG